MAQLTETEIEFVLSVYADGNALFPTSFPGGNPFTRMALAEGAPGFFYDESTRYDLDRVFSLRLNEDDRFIAASQETITAINASFLGVQVAIGDNLQPPIYYGDSYRN